MPRRFFSLTGVRWEVLEAPDSLYFLSRAGSRRCDDYPADWAKQSAREIASLCLRARPLAEQPMFAGWSDAAEPAQAAFCD